MNRRRTWKYLITASAVAAVASIAPTLSFCHTPAPSSAFASEITKISTAVSQQPEVTPGAAEYEYLHIAFSKEQSGEFWLSVDGTHDGLMRRPDLDPAHPDIVIPGCRDGEQAILRGDGNTPTGATAACTPHPIVDSSIPSTSSGMLALFTDAASQAPTESAPNVVGKRMQQLLEFTLLTKQQRVALMQAASELPGLTGGLTQSTAQVPGSLSINWTTADKQKAGLVVDPSTEQYVSSIGGSDTVFTRAIVSAVGVEP